MALVRQPDSPGLWVNPDWVAGTPGTFAVVVGVSAYPHLVGGAGPAADDAYDLPQLYVSALTAHRFFCWLRDRYVYGGSPLAQVWLLLAPTDDELAAEPAQCEHALPPTFGNCEEAVTGWFGTMKRLPKASAQGSRAFFFFSGHGLELYRDKQLLLPADYLRPPACNVNRALSTYNLYAGLAALEVPHQIFFADACRNDHQRLLGSDLEGTDVLNVWANYRANRNVIAPVLYASASGSQAWQPRTPAEGPSLFGRALLEGLQAQAGFAPDCSSEPCTVRLYSLQTFIERRLTQLLQEFGASGIQQPVRLNGGSDLTVTCVEKATAVAAAAPPPPSRLEAQDIVFAVRPPLVDWHPLAILRRPDRPGATLSAHEVFGSQRLTAAWEQARLFNLASRTWQPATAYTIHSVERDVPARAQRIVLSLTQANEASHWLQLDFGATSFACLLPGDLYGATRYLIELSRDAQGLVTRLEVGLAPDNPGPLGSVAALWEKYETINAAAAVANLDLPMLEELVLGKLQSPLGATMAAVILLRAGRRDLLHDWVRNLAEWFPDRPDGPVLWAEHLLLETTGRRLPTEAVDWLLRLRQRGLPHCAEVLGWAVRQNSELLERARLGKRRREALGELHQQLRQARRFFRSGELFTVFAGPSGTFGPELVLPLESNTVRSSS